MKRCITSSIRITMLRNAGVLLHILFLKIGPLLFAQMVKGPMGQAPTRVPPGSHPINTPHPFLLVSDLTRLPFIITGPPSREKRSGCKIFGCNQIECLNSI